MIRFKTFRYSLGILIISAALCGFWQRANAQIVEIPDPNLERAIRERLELSSDFPITQQEMLRLFRLHANGMQIESITGLEYATNLERLHLEANRITDIGPLSNLTALQTLRLGHNYIVDISPLANLTRLKELDLFDNLILDFSPIQGLSLVDFRYDEVCLLPDPPIRDRIENRSFPSIHQGWRGGTNLSPLSPEDFIAQHDIYWLHVPFGLHLLPTPPWNTLAGVIEDAIAKREEYLAKNPNMIFLSQTLINSASYRHYPEDWFGWVRDENGNPVRSDPDFRDLNLIDMRLPEVQDIIVQQAVAVSKCGLYDGIQFDWWPEGDFILTSYNADGSVRDRELVEEDITLSMIQRIRANVPEDFLILCNTNWDKLPITGSYINGSFMETYPIELGKGYTRPRIAEIEDTLLWFEENAREPQISCLRGHGIPTEPPDSPTNRRQMRLFTTMSLTLSDGYVMYTTGGRTKLTTLVSQGRWFSEHIWYPFWDADLGQPVGPIAQRYRDIEGLYIREFTNGWAVYNRSGDAQTVTLPSSATSVSDRGSTAASITHLLPDLDGEIYLKTKHPADVNGDRVVNILDLVEVSNNFGQSSPDPNGDGVVNILDLVFVSRYLSAEE